MIKRESGILLHISSLPSEFGIGDFGEGAYNFLDFLHKSGQTYWQILPLGVTGYGDSPYQSFSAYAGNPYFIDLQEFVNEGVLSQGEVKVFGNSEKVDYGHLYEAKYKLLRKVYSIKKASIESDLTNFYEAEKHWLRGFALFMALKDSFKGQGLLSWQDGYKNINDKKVAEFEKTHQDEIGFWKFTQLYFYRQWFRLKEKAEKLGIKIIGDLPIYVSEDSADLFSNLELFKLDQNNKPISVAGCPPDMFSPTGQLWGNPIYDWESHKAQDFRWWKDRIKHTFRLFDTVRIDHFRGFESFWDIPYGDLTAEHGKWIPAPGHELFKSIKAELGDLEIIAEDLGVITEEVEALRAETGFPGMKVLEFAFDDTKDSKYLPHRYDFNCVAYTGTHDNDTVVGWLREFKEKETPELFEFAKDYMNLSSDEDYLGVIRTVWSSPARIAICQFQDLLGLDTTARMNMPSTTGTNWQYRCNKSDFSEQNINLLKKLTTTYARSR